eukprot:jgi/Ulvmu1/4155/UM019_0134.1
MDDGRPYTEAQLSRYRHLVRFASRWLFSGDLTARITEAYLDDSKPDAPRKRKRSKISESNLAVVIVDGLSYHEGWVSEEKFCQKLSLGGKQVRRMMQFLEKQGFIVREHRREKKQGNKVESVAEQDQLVAQPRTATYVTIDYPHMVDMLRLRLHLVKKHAKDRIGSSDGMQPYACCSRDGIEPVCGMKYNESDLSYLDLSPVDKLFMCAACDNGVVVPDDPLSQSEVSGERRIKSARKRREAATAQRIALMSALKPLDHMLSNLENVDPPDFGSFTDWAQRRQTMLATGAATAAGGDKRGGTSRGHLDYGIDGPLVGDAGIAVEVGGEDEPEAKKGRVIDASSKTPDPKASLPYFMQKQKQAPAAESVAAAESQPPGGAQESERYKQFIAQFHAQMEQQVANANIVKEEEKSGHLEDDGDGFEFEDALPTKEEVANDGTEKVFGQDDGEAEDGLEWEDA